jgi:hypothetical protein
MATEKQTWRGIFLGRYNLQCNLSRHIVRALRGIAMRLAKYFNLSDPIGENAVTAYAWKFVEI